MLKTEGQRLIYEYDGETMWIEPWGENSLRVRCAANTGASQPINETLAWALLEPARTDAVAAMTEWEGEPAARLQNGLICAVVQQNGRVTFTRPDGGVLLQEFVRDRTVKGTNFSPMMIRGREFSPQRGPDRSLAVRFESDPEEKLFGMGQYQQEIFNLKGAVLELA